MRFDSQSIDKCFHQLDADKVAEEILDDQILRLAIEYNVLKVLRNLNLCVSSISCLLTMLSLPLDMIPESTMQEVHKELVISVGLEFLSLHCSR